MNTLARTNETLCPIWCRLYNLKNAKNTNAKVIFLVKLKAKASGVFFKIFKLHKCYQIVQSITCFFNPLVPGLSYGIDTGTNIKPIFFETTLYTFLQTTKKINKQAEIGQKLNNLPNNHPTSKKSYSNIFFQSIISIQALSRKENLVSENVVRLCFLALEINTENTPTKVSIRYPMGQKGNLPSTKC